jgi:hypothetical protein
VSRSPARRSPSVWSRARLILQREGFAGFTSHLVRRCLRPVLSWDTVSFFAWDDLAAVTIPQLQARIPLDVRLAGASDWSRLRELPQEAGRGQEEFETRLARGDLCFIGLSDDRLVHVFWVAVRESWIPALGATLRLEPGDAYAYESFTAENIRGQGVQPAVTVFVLRYEQAHGFRRHLFYIERHNRAALRALPKYANPPFTLTRTLRAVRMAGLPGAVILGLGPGGPRLEFPPGVRVRRLGRLGQWVRQAS